MIDYYSRLFGSSMSPGAMAQAPSFLQDPYAVQFQEADDSPMSMEDTSGGLSNLLSGRQPSPMDEQPNDGIDVPGPWSPDMMPRQGRPDSEYTLDNTRDVQMMREANRRAEEAADYKGMFGVKGTLRDVLGLLGDAFLVQGGANKVYEPRRQQERAAASMAGMSRDPYAAGERTIGVDAALGRDIIDQADQQAFRRQQLASQDAARQSLIEERARKARKAATDYAQSVLFQPGAITADGSLSPGAMQALRFAATAGEIPVEQLVAEISEANPEAARLFAGAGMTVNQQRTAGQRDEQLEIGRRNATSGERRAATGERNASTAARNASTSARRVDVSDPNARASVRNALDRGVRPEDLPAGAKLVYDKMVKDGTITSGRSGGSGETRRQLRGTSSAPASSGGNWTIRPAGQ